MLDRMHLTKDALSFDWLISFPRPSVSWEEREVLSYFYPNEIAVITCERKLKYASIEKSNTMLSARQQGARRSWSKINFTFLLNPNEAYLISQ